MFTRIMSTKFGDHVKAEQKKGCSFNDAWRSAVVARTDDFIRELERLGHSREAIVDHLRGWIGEQEARRAASRVTTALRNRG